MSDTFKWDKYYLNICRAVASKSHCHSRQIGAILVKDKVVISTGYNGPARKVPECRERYYKDENLIKTMKAMKIEKHEIDRAYVKKTCPRRVLKFPSGEGLEWCNSVHSEKNCLLSAARNGIATKGATMYADMDITPCTQCFSALIQCGIKELVLVKFDIYDATVKWVNKYSEMTIREFGSK